MSDFGQLLGLVDECLEKKHRPDPKLVKQHNADPLNKDYQLAVSEANLIKAGELVERSDVVHDILSFLAEEMMKMNKAKQDEIKGFLNYLQRRIGQDIEGLKNKTRVKEYYKANFNSLVKVISDNKIRLNRQKEEDLEKEFIRSVNKLKPLLDRIEATDKLINRIVYKLYGLNKEEIKIIEGQG